MEKEFVEYTEALAMKELGYDEECLKIYIIDNNNIITLKTWAEIRQFHLNETSKWWNRSNSDLSTYTYNAIAAPLFQQAFRWFREKYGWHGEPSPDVNNNWGVFTHDLNIGTDYYDVSIQRTYEEAQLAVLQQLIKIVQNGSNKDN